MRPFSLPPSTFRPLLLSLLLAGAAGLTPVAVVGVGEAPDSADSAATLLAAARAGELAEVRRLLDSGAPVDATDRFATTPLLAAVRGGHLEVARELLARGADPDRAESFHGTTPLLQALFSERFDIARLLVESGADDRAAALRAALGAGDEALARAVVASGPIYASALAELRAASREDGVPAVFRELLAGAESRPDPAPPEYSPAELERYAGVFEGHVSDGRVEAAVAGGALTLAVDGAPARVVEAVGEDRFRAVGEGETEGLEATFWGRAGSIEGLTLRRGGGEAESLRRSVAEPVGAAALEARLREVASEAAAGEEGGTAVRTVHWPSFRGPNASGVGDGDPAPTEWDLGTGEGVLWTAELPGLGNSSPVVWGDRVFVTTAVAAEGEQEIRTGLTGAGDPVEESSVHSWRVLAFDKASGEKLWETEVGRGVPLTKRHFKATQANSTPAVDGTHLAVVFPTAGLAVLDLDGEIRWKHELGGLNAGAFSDPGIEWGFASSPLLHGGRVILQADVHEGPYLAAWDVETGERVWRVDRDVSPSWSTPVVVAGPEGEELVANGSTIHAYDPATGEELWSLAPNSELVIAAPVAGEGRVYVSAGYAPVKPIYAVPVGTRGALEVDPRAGDPRLAWSHGVGGAYMPTPLLYRGLYYVVHHNGRLVAYDAASGVPIYKSRFSRGGVFTASPVAVEGKLYLPTEEGHLYVLEAGPEYREVAVHELGEPLMATPAVSEGVLFVRTPSRLLALGEEGLRGGGVEAGEGE